MAGKIISESEYYRPSVIKHFSFFGFLNPENPGKWQKTWKQRDLGTYVPFGENLTALDTTKTYENLL